MQVQAMKGTARQGKLYLDEEGLGNARPVKARQRMPNLGTARQCKARPVKARQGKATLAKFRQGKARQT